MKKHSGLTIAFVAISLASLASTSLKKSHKGDFYFYWGWNRSAYTTSDMQFQGDDYQFNLGNVKAKDRQTVFQWDIYFNPKLLTIPQYNMRFGYFFSEHYEFSLGVDHMKYIMVQDQTVYIDGDINIGSKYDGSYYNDAIQLKKDFLIFEHSDGLNYINAALRRFDVLWTYKFLEVGSLGGVELGGLMPRTNATLLSNPRNDEFHWAGYGASAVLGLKLSFWNHFFISTEGKAGVINMPDVRTTPSKSDRASHNFSFVQGNILFGVNFNLLPKEKTTE